MLFRSVAGIVSEKPAFRIGSGTMLALAGRVPVKVTNENGNIKIGDLLTTSSISGYAMKCNLKDILESATIEEAVSIMRNNEKCRNSILGKALEPCNQKACKIMALVTLQ